MLPIIHERFFPLQVVNLPRIEVVNFSRSMVVSLNRTEVVNFVGFSTNIKIGEVRGTSILLIDCYKARLLQGKKSRTMCSGFFASVGM